jgi:hypothetical protein
MSYDELCDYLTQLREHSGMFDVRIEWQVIRADQVCSLTAGKRMGLQIADAVASSMFCAVQVSQYGFVEPRYARMLAPVVYSRKGWHVGYGLKFWPRDVLSLLAEERYSWIGEVYK